LVVCLLKSQDVPKAGLITNEFNLGNAICEFNGSSAVSFGRITKFFDKIPPVKRTGELGKVCI